MKSLTEVMLKDCSSVYSYYMPSEVYVSIWLVYEWKYSIVDNACMDGRGQMK